MMTKSRQTYINKWTAHINELGALAFTNDKKLSDAVREIMKQLHELVPKIANTKDLK